LKEVGILVPNESEAKVLLGRDPQEDVAPAILAEDLYRSSQAKCVLITLGEQGIVGIDERGKWASYPPQVKVVDTSGAGDVFCAALATGLAQDVPVREASEWACKAAAFSVTRGGTIPSFPTIDEVKEVPGLNSIVG
jgi:ribokinase